MSPVFIRIGGSMNHVMVLSQKMAVYWHGKWVEALKEKDFGKAEEYFHKAMRWKRKANIVAPMGQHFIDEGVA